MKIILSRKGFDSGYGGYPSPILPDDRLVSLPIPSDDNIHYSELMIDSNLTYYDVMSDLRQNIKVKNDKKKWERKPLKENTTCHLDPDIYRNAIERPKDWKPIFGQVDAAQTHLKNKGVEEGDIFLFFGTFKKTEYKGECLTFIREEPEIHIIFGYLQIEEIKSPDTRCPDWMNYHPHIDSDRLRKKKNNTIYIARNTLSWNSMLPGAAPFNFHEDLVLTKEGETKSRWALPSFFKKVKISYHSEKSWEHGDYFQSAPIGQEFVIEDKPMVEEWVKNLISPTED